MKLPHPTRALWTITLRRMGADRVTWDYLGLVHAHFETDPARGQDLDARLLAAGAPVLNFRHGREIIADVIG